jgi:hypothetical protein
MNLLSKILNEPSLGAWFETNAGEEGLGFCASLSGVSADGTKAA